MIKLSKLFEDIVKESEGRIETNNYIKKITKSLKKTKSIQPQQKEEKLIKPIKKLL